MEYTFNTLITHLDIIPSLDGLENIVKRVHWKVDCVNDGKYYYEEGNYTLPSASDTDFTAYGNLTKEQVLSWLAGNVDFDAIKATLTTKIDNEAHPTINIAVPFEN
jgi:hypothetical protein